MVNAIQIEGKLERQEKIDELKRINDWGKELNFEKMSEKINNIYDYEHTIKKEIEMFEADSKTELISSGFILIYSAILLPSTYSIIINPTFSFGYI